jgi:hypothetical protein
MPILRSQIRAALGTSWPPEVPLEFVRESVGLVRQTRDLSGLRGTRAPLAEQLIAGPRSIEGELHLQPTLGELVALLPTILGGNWLPGTAGSHVCSPREIIPDVTLAIDRPPRLYRYSGCKFVLARLIARCGQPVALTLGVAGIDETVEDHSLLPEPAVARSPLRFTDVHLVVNGTPRECSHVEIVIENVALGDRYVHSLTRVDLPIVDRRLGVTLELPFEATSHDLDPSPESLAFAHLRLATGTEAVEFLFPRVRFTTQFSSASEQTPLGLTLAGLPTALPGEPELRVVYTPHTS